ncbi:hypothetical protein H4582DRAFT_2083684 [Lactarius indigo]|nr:hypothetical protein H4582DRAFT_2083684 [Lactarius indigo]
MSMAHVLAALGNKGPALRVLELSLDGTSGEVSLRALYKQVGSLSPNAKALQRLCLQATLTTKTAKAEEGP